MRDVPTGTDDERDEPLPGRGETPSSTVDHESQDREDARPEWRPGRRAPRVGVIGSSGSGKTTLMKAIVYSWLDETPNVRFLVWDHTIEWGESHPNLHVFSSVNWTLEEVCAVALELGDCTVVADEIDMETSSKEGLKRGTAIHSVINYGRHHNVGLLWGVRRCPDIPRGLTANTAKLFVLLTHEPNDLEWLESKTGDSSVVERAATQEVGAWFLWEAGKRKEAA